MANYNSDLIGNLDDKAFEFVRHHLYSIISYKYLKETDIRKMDITEEFFRLTSELSSDAELVGGTLELYATLLHTYIEESLKCERNSSAIAFKERALETSSIETIKATDKKDAVLEDALVIFLSAMRTIMANKDNKSFKGVKTIEPSVKAKDADIIVTLYESRHFAPKAIKQSYEKKPLAKEVSRYQKRCRVAYFAFVSIIKLATILQDFGEFED